MKKPVQLKKADAYVYRGTMNYLIAYDYSAGKADRYTVLVLNDYDPVTIGRELDLPTVCDLIGDYEMYAKRLPYWTGQCVDVYWCRDQVTAFRLENAFAKAK